MSDSFETASKILLKTSAFIQSRKRLTTEFHFPNSGGKSRHELPVRAIYSTASKNKRPSPPVWPGSFTLPLQCDCILAHWAAVKLMRAMKISLRKLNQKRRTL